MKKKEIKSLGLSFNPSNYDYLDTASLNDYIAEFLSRNQAFRKDYSESISLPQQKRFDKEIELLKKYGIFLNVGAYLQYRNSHKSIEDYMKSEKKLYGIVINKSISAFRIIKKNETGNDAFDEEMEKIRQRLIEKGDITNFSWTNYSIGLNKKTIENLLYAFFGILSEHEMDYPMGYPCNDTLLLAIRLNNPKEKIEEDIKKILKMHKKKKKSSLRLDKWKLYLMVYDFKEGGLTYKQIGDALEKAYPQKAHTFYKENLKNYYKTADKLINKVDYLRYI